MFSRNDVAESPEPFATETEGSSIGSLATSYNATRPISPTEGLIRRKPVHTHGRDLISVPDITNTLPVSTITRKPVHSAASRVPVAASGSLISEPMPSTGIRDLQSTNVETSPTQAEITYANVKKGKASMNAGAENRYKDTKVILSANTKIETSPLLMQSNTSLSQIRTSFMKLPPHSDSLKSRSCNDFLSSDLLSNALVGSKVPGTILQEKTQNAAQRCNSRNHPTEEIEKTFDYHNLSNANADFVTSTVHGHHSAKASITSLLDDAQASIIALGARFASEESKLSAFSKNSVDSRVIGASGHNNQVSVRNHKREGSLRLNGQHSAQSALNINLAHEGQDNAVFTKIEKKSLKKKMDKVKLGTSNRIESKGWQQNTNGELKVSPEQLQAKREYEAEQKWDDYTHSMVQIRENMKLVTILADALLY